MENQINISDIIKALYRRRMPAIVIFIVIAIASLSYAILAKPTYRSSATILIEQQEIPQDLVRSTVTSFADQRIQMTIQRVMTFAKLSELIKKYDLYQEMRKEEPLEAVVTQMRSDISHNMISAEVVDPRSGRPVVATIAFTIAYFSQSAKMAQTVANELTSLFLQDNIKNRTEMAEEAESFLISEVNRLERKSKELEKSLAEFKEKNLKKLPELTSLNMNLLDRAEREYFELSRQIQGLEERKVYLEAQLTQQDPHADVLGDSRERVLTPSARAKFLQNSYMSLRAKYSEEHPDVIKTRRELNKLVAGGDLPKDREFLEQQLDILESEHIQLLSRYGADHPDVASVERQTKILNERINKLSFESSVAEDEGADNPAYVHLATSLETVKVELQHTKESRNKIKEKLSELEKSLLEGPSVEREYRSLSRDYENTTVKYQEVKAKQLEASLARSLEVERKGERFTLIEPPLLPIKPVKPNRRMIVVAGLIFSLLCALGIVFILEKLDETISSGRALENFVGAPPIAVIPHIATYEEVIAKKRIMIMMFGAAIASVGVVTVAVHMLYMPLDVLWFVAMRKIG